MLTLHQLRCFEATVQGGSLTAAASDLGLAQPSVAEQIRTLERSLGVSLFRRVGRGVVPTEAADLLLPHARRTLAAAQEAADAVAATREMLSGTVRFGLFGTARLYVGAELAADLLQRYPDLRVELIGQHSQHVLAEMRRGRLEAALIALPVPDASLAVRPVGRDEEVYVSTDPDRVRRPVTADALARARLALSESSWRDQDPAWLGLASRVQAIGENLDVQVLVEDVETSLEIAATGVVDTIAARGVLRRLGDRIPGLHWNSLRPRLFDEFAIVHRKDVPLSRPTAVVVELVVQRMRQALGGLLPPERGGAAAGPTMDDARP
ncbi:LysR family transcriptional regulator [Nakamurella sp. YIM 132087]|uniref:LysR family transcriptional regulator n=1 Tax=Nakamurella alba TaxID=2665158 RepID=A0A7K1FIW7_9ACTN|nr:LysR family transcriptional regulator [Nakamurella alba]MTD14061.1 LysR family transcriptional regulator [Nakamurella alba]